MIVLDHTPMTLVVLVQHCGAVFGWGTDSAFCVRRAATVGQTLDYYCTVEAERLLFYLMFVLHGRAQHSGISGCFRHFPRFALQ